MVTNAITVSGNVCNELVLRRTATGKAVCDFRVAATRRAQVRGEWVDKETTFFTVTAWDRLAENASDSLRTGDLVLVAGRLKDDSWTDPDGVTRAKLIVQAESLGPDLSRYPAPVRRLRPDPTPQERSGAASGDVDPRSGDEWTDEVTSGEEGSDEAGSGETGSGEEDALHVPADLGGLVPDDAREVDAAAAGV